MARGPATFALAHSAFDIEFPRMDRELIGRSPQQDGLVDGLVDRLRTATSPNDVVLPLLAFARSTAPESHFPKTLNEFVKTGSVNAMTALRPAEIDILLRAWGVKPPVSTELANRTRLVLPMRRGPAPISGKPHVGNLENRLYLQLADGDLFARDGAQLAAVLKQVMTKAELTPTEMAKKTGIVRSQIYYLIGSKSLPRKREQLEAFLTACQLHPEQARFVLEQWRWLDQHRGEPAPPESAEKSNAIHAVAATVESTTVAATAPEEKAIRVDGPDGRSFTITGRHDDTDRQQLAEMLVKVTTAKDRIASRTTQALSMVAAVSALLMAVLSFIEMRSDTVTWTAGFATSAMPDRPSMDIWDVVAMITAALLAAGLIVLITRRTTLMRREGRRRATDASNRPRRPATARQRNRKNRPPAGIRLVA